MIWYQLKVIIKTMRINGYREYMSTYYNKLNSYAMYKYECIQIYTYYDFDMNHNIKFVTICIRF